MAASVKNVLCLPVPRPHRPHTSFRIMIQAHKRRRCVPLYIPAYIPAVLWGAASCRAEHGFHHPPSRFTTGFSSIFPHCAALCQKMPTCAEKALFSMGFKRSRVRIPPARPLGTKAGKAITDECGFWRKSGVAPGGSPNGGIHDQNEDRRQEPRDIFASRSRGSKSRSPPGEPVVLGSEEDRRKAVYSPAPNCGSKNCGWKARRMVGQPQESESRRSRHGCDSKRVQEPRPTALGWLDAGPLALTIGPKSNHTLAK